MITNFASRYWHMCHKISGGNVSNVGHGLRFFLLIISGLKSSVSNTGTGARGVARFFESVFFFSMLFLGQRNVCDGMHVGSAARFDLGQKIFQEAPQTQNLLTIYCSCSCNVLSNKCDRIDFGFGLAETKQLTSQCCGVASKRTSLLTVLEWTNNVYLH